MDEDGTSFEEEDAEENDAEEEEDDDEADDDDVSLDEAGDGTVVGATRSLLASREGEKLSGVKIHQWMRNGRNLGAKYANAIP